MASGGVTKFPPSRARFVSRLRVSSCIVMSLVRLACHLQVEDASRRVVNHAGEHYDYMFLSSTSIKMFSVSYKPPRQDGSEALMPRTAFSALKSHFAEKPLGESLGGRRYDTTTFSPNRPTRNPKTNRSMPFFRLISKQLWDGLINDNVRNLLPRFGKYLPTHTYVH